MTIHSKLREFSLPVFLAFAFAVGCSPPAKFENERGNVVSASGASGEIPTGFRRTVNGWEDTSMWHVAPDYKPKSIDGWMDQQRDREASWLRRVLNKIRQTPPLMVALIQITAIAAIVRISRVDKK